MVREITRLLNGGYLAFKTALNFFMVKFEGNMRRLLIYSCILSTIVLATLIIFRSVTKRRTTQPQENAQYHLDRVRQIAATLSEVKTRSVSPEEYGQLVRKKARASLSVPSSSEQEKLFACIDRFFACYSSGDYENFRHFRLRPPLTASERVISFVKDIASKKGTDLKSEDDTLRYAWDHFNGTNRIAQVDVENVILSVVESKDLGSQLRRFSIAKFPETGASCWEGSVVYNPNPAELLKKHGALRFFVLEQFVRFNQLVDGPATPLLLIGYWDPDRGDWMPLALCTMLQVGGYDTML